MVKKWMLNKDGKAIPRQEHTFAGVSGPEVVDIRVFRGGRGKLFCQTAQLPPLQVPVPGIDHNMAQSNLRFLAQHQRFNLCILGDY